MRVKTDRRVKPEIGFFSSSLENKRDKCVSGFTTPFTSYINVSKSSREKKSHQFHLPTFLLLHFCGGDGSYPCFREKCPP